jgi:4-diphosphocytidyl-2-C-methyl-D-erythritol kinase
MIRLEAPAKLTTSLRVVGRRQDGYHLLEAEMTLLDLCDELHLEENRDGFVVIDEIDWSGLPGTGESEPAGALEPGGNLVEKALLLTGRRASCRLLKRIPAAAGLGGGSSDAAAILRWAGTTDLELAARLGADVPFCLVGGTARVSGIGEVVEPIEPSEDQDAFLLVTPRMRVFTPRVFAAYDELSSPKGTNGNDLEPAALAAYPSLAWWRDLLAAASGRRPRLAGSGGTWFLTGEADELRELEAQVRAEIVAGRESALVTVRKRLRGPVG